MRPYIKYTYCIRLITCQLRDNPHRGQSDFTALLSVKKSPVAQCLSHRADINGQLARGGSDLIIAHVAWIFPGICGARGGAHAQYI